MALAGLDVSSGSPRAYYLANEGERFVATVHRLISYGGRDLPLGPRIEITPSFPSVPDNTGNELESPEVVAAAEVMELSIEHGTRQGEDEAWQLLVHEFAAPVREGDEVVVEGENPEVVGLFMDRFISSVVTAGLNRAGAA